MARVPNLSVDPARLALIEQTRRDAEKSLALAVANHDDNEGKVQGLHLKLLGREEVEKTAVEAKESATRAREHLAQQVIDAETKKKEAEAAAQVEEEKSVEAARIFEVAKQASLEVTEAREAARKSGLLVASTFDQAESCRLYKELATVINSNKLLHPQVMCFAIQMLLDTVLRKARTLYKIPG